MYGLAKPALLFGDDPAVMGGTSALFEAAEVRLAGQAPLADAAARLDQQISVGLVWLECGGVIPPDALLDRLARLAETGEAAVVAGTEAAIHRELTGTRCCASSAWSRSSSMSHAGSGCALPRRGAKSIRFSADEARRSKR